MDGRALEFASGRLRNDLEVAMEAVSEDWHALEMAAHGPKDNRDIVMKARHNHDVGHLRPVIP